MEFVASFFPDDYIQIYVKVMFLLALGSLQFEFMSNLIFQK